MTTELSIDTKATDLASAPLTWQALTRIAGTEFVPASLRGKPDAVLAAVFTGREIGLSPMASLRLVDIIDGTPSLSAELTVALIRAAGHTIRLDEETPEACTVTGIRAGDGHDRMTVSYSLVDAERAGLVTVDEDGRPRARSRNGKPLPWEAHTSDMLWARAVSRLARRLFPDVTAAPARTVAAAYASETDPVDDEAAATYALMTLGAMLEGEPELSTAQDAEVHLRRLCRLAVTSGTVVTDPLPTVLARFGAAHVADLRAAEVRAAVAHARDLIADAYAQATGRDTRPVTPDAHTRHNEPEQE